MGNLEDLLEAAAYFCVLEGVRLDVPCKPFVGPELIAAPPTQPEDTIAELLR